MDELKNAIKIISDYCYNCEDCEQCPLFSKSEGECIAWEYRPDIWNQLINKEGEN